MNDNTAMALGKAITRLTDTVRDAGDRQAAATLAAGIVSAFPGGATPQSAANFYRQILAIIATKD